LSTVGSARHRLMTGGVVLLAVVVVVLLVVIGGGRASAKTDTSAPPTCLRSQIRVALVGWPIAGLGHVASVIRVTNASDKACSLTGYPRVTGVSASGVQRIFKDTLDGYLGGLYAPMNRAKPPVATLRAHLGVASSMEETVLHPKCPSFASYVVSLPHVTGGTYTFHPRPTD